MKSSVDLHLHTTASDGRMNPADLIRKLINNGLSLVAITDHDSTEGIAAAQQEANNQEGFELIHGVELGADVPDGEIHMLGYFLNVDDENFQKNLQRFRDGRALRGLRMVEKLNEIGMEIEWERVQEYAQGGAITRPHIALALLEKGYVLSFEEAFEKFIGRDGLAYVGREKLTPEQAIELIHENGGLSVLAHPARYVNNLEEILPKLKQAGLIGMEAHYKDYTVGEIDYLLSLCQTYDLIPCGGSDYHALGTSDEVEPGLVGPPMESVERLKERVKSTR